VFPEGRTRSGKRLVPQLAVGCVLFALIGLFGTFLLANALQPYFKGKRTELAKQAEAREAQGRKDAKP
jgi:hypothetical protein